MDQQQQDKYLLLLQSEAKLQFELQEALQSLKQLEPYKVFYETALQGIEIFEKQPDLIKGVKKMPAMYKEMFIEYLDYVGRQMITAALDKAESNLSLRFINGMRVCLNQMVKHILDINIKEEQGYSLVTRSKIENNKIVLKRKKAIDIGKK